NGPLHGYIYLIKNSKTTEHPKYEKPELIYADNSPIDVYGMPSANFADFDNDGDLDIICGEFIDKFTYFENIGNRANPKYTKGKYLSYLGKAITMDLEMIIPVAIDWDKDGDIDLIVGQEDGRVAFIENTGILVNNIPQFKQAQFFTQHADKVKFGALVTPFSTDWDNDGDEDLICGNTAGYIGFIENLDGKDSPKWAEPVYLKAEDKIIRIQADYNGSIQGPCEAKWGYTTLSVGDWDNDGLKDILINSIWGKISWYKNIGTENNPKLAKAEPIKVEWNGVNPKPAWNWWKPEGNNLVTQWRTTPYIFDWNQDGLMDLIMLDHEGFLAFFERIKHNNELILLPGKRIFYNENGTHLQLNPKAAGKSGRKKFTIIDWDLDGKLDILINSKNINFFKNISNNDNNIIFKDMGMLSKHILAGHTTSPTIVDWNRNGIPDLLIGAEDGYFYFLHNPKNKK
ncbi:MAG: VCBS repeat-containing protein, partial [Bacteroidetes bacterium]